MTGRATPAADDIHLHAHFMLASSAADPRPGPVRPVWRHANARRS